MKRVIGNTILLSSLLLAGGDLVPIVEPIEVEEIESPVQVVEILKTKNWFLGLNGSYISLDVSQDPSNLITTNFIPEYEGISYGVELGFNYSDALFYTLNYDYLDLDQAFMQNITASVNYKINGFYAGLVAGISSLEWDEAPTATYDDETSEEFIYGVKLGYEYQMSDDLTVYTQYQFLQTEHLTEIISGAITSNILYESINHTTIGIRYQF